MKRNRRNAVGSASTDLVGMDNLPSVVRRSPVELELYRHQQRAELLVVRDEIDTNALGEALEFALKEEAAMVDKIRATAKGDPVVTELGARKLELFASANNNRARMLARRLS